MNRLLYIDDDGIVVVVMEKLSTIEYFRLPESMRPMELVHGYVREPPAPRYGHQSIVTRLTALLDTHVRANALGQVCVSPVDVVLDDIAALVLQPDIIFVSRERLGIIHDRVWGAPDLVVEVLSSQTGKRDRTTKLEWYRRYGVGECWLVHPMQHWIDVEPLSVYAQRGRYSGTLAIRSIVLPTWRMSAEEIFG